MPRGEGRHIYFTQPTLKRLERYIRRNFGGHHALSMIVQKAVDEFLDKEETSGVGSKPQVLK